MSHLNSEAWLAVMRDTVSSYRRMIDETIEQLTDVELFTRPDREVTSVAICEAAGLIFKQRTARRQTEIGILSSWTGTAVGNL